MKSYDTLLKREKIVYKLLTLGIVAVILFFLWKVAVNTVNGYGYPKEILEPASVNFTRTLLEGNNPYVRANIVEPGNEPPVNYEYPFLNNIFAAAISKLLAVDVLAGHYLVSFAAMIGTAFLGASIIKRYSRTTVGPTLGFFLLLLCNWRYGFISACPDGFGLFVTMLTVDALLTPGKKKRALLCAFGTVAAFYSKQYFAGICISIFLFMLCYSFKEAMKYFFWCVTLLAASVVLINRVWPLYWDYSLLFLMQGCFRGVNLDGILYVLEQLKYLAVVFAGLLAVVAFSAVKAFRSKTKKAKAGTQTEANAQNTDNAQTSDSTQNADSVQSSADTVNADNAKTSTNTGNAGPKKNKPEKTKKIHPADAVWFFIIQIPVQMVVLFFFGRNDGAYLTYFLQLLIPSVVMLAMILMEKMETGKFEWVFMGAYALLVAASVYFGMGKLPMHMITEEEKVQWQQAYDLLAEYRTKGDIYHYQATAYDGAANGDSLYCTGHDGDIGQRGYDEWQNNEWQKKLFPDAGRVFEENLAYRDVMKDKIKNHEIAMITIPEGGVLYISKDELSEAGYSCVESKKLQLGNVFQNVEFWAVN